MKDWYKAVCDEHKEYCDCLVRSNYTMFAYTQTYLGDQEKDIHTWFELHSGCDLRLIYRDEELDVIFESDGGPYVDALKKSGWNAKKK